MLTFIIGGMKSGKSKFALQEAEKLPYKNFYFIATAKAIDKEMQERIEKHKKQRHSRWITIEEPIDLAGAIKKIPENSAVVVDCLTTWITNLIVENHHIEKFTETFLSSLKTFKDKKNVHIFVVSNETGFGVIPTTELGRKFIDLAGMINQKVMEIADTAYLIIAGMPVKIK